MVIEVARVARRARRAPTRASSTPTTRHPVIDLMDDQVDVTDKGGTMRLGSYERPARCPARRWPRPTATWSSPSATATATRSTPATATQLEEAGLVCSGISPDGRLVEFIELPGHPFWVGTQAHPEFKSRPDRPHPLFRELVGAALVRAEGRDPRLIDIGAVG